jgi:hypothetical protein
MAERLKGDGPSGSPPGRGGGGFKIVRRYGGTIVRRPNQKLIVFIIFTLIFTVL